MSEQDCLELRWTIKKQNTPPNSYWDVVQGKKIIFCDLEKQAALSLAECHNCCLKEIEAMKVLTASAVGVAEKLKKEVADLKKERDMWIFNAQELQKGFNKLDKERKHWLGDLEQIQELKAIAERLKQQNSDLFNRIDTLLRAGQMCSNCCFNIAQQERLTDGNAKPLIESYKAWDEAATAVRKAMRSE